ncbi:MAG: hypothetical protein WA890_26890 [Micromonospora sp.]
MSVGSTSGVAGLRGNRQRPQQAGFVELLFDVVFVFAFTRLSQRLVEHLHRRGFYTTMLPSVLVGVVPAVVLAGIAVADVVSSRRRARVHGPPPAPAG